MHTLLSFLPLLILLSCLLIFKMTAGKSGALAVLSSIIIAYSFFGLNIPGLTIAMSKGMSLALYVLLIIWSAVFLYHLVYEFEAIDVINKNILIFIKDPFTQFLLLAWLFSSVLQGIAGFGVPVIIVVPILIHLGFDKLSSVSAVLLGHSWSVSFGSMGSSFFTISLVTNLNQQSIGYAMGIFDALAMIMMGLTVCYIYGGWKYVKRGLPYVIPTSLVMIAVMFTVLYFNLVSLVGLLTALSGLLTMFLIYTIKEKPGKPEALYAGKLTLGKALIPYTTIIVLSLLFQVLKLGKYSISFKYPAFITDLGHVVAQEAAYSRIKIFGHPAPIIIMSAIVGMLVYKQSGIWDTKKIKNVIKRTIDKNIGTTITLVFLITMALVMMDSGMTNTLALKVSELTGNLYPLFAPLFGILGSFITGSNTNSNVIFGKFQMSVATALGVNSYVMSGLQSISGSIGVSLGPTTILMAASASGLTGHESEIYKRVIKPVLLTALLMGILNYLLLFVLKIDIGGML
ncbi:MAG: L-lactate permease [Clostridiales bacterium 38_11]|nr:MAG: L-lactate permease [Clostridiales bacterium 38_11]